MVELLKLTGLTHITKEPILRESNIDGEGTLRVDWGVRGFWDFQREALFDIRILNADALSEFLAQAGLYLMFHRGRLDFVFVHN